MSVWFFNKSNTLNEIPQKHLKNETYFKIVPF